MNFSILVFNFIIFAVIFWSFVLFTVPFFLLEMIY